ncbi:MAG: hypothetical protein Q8L23_09190 [Caulobacter sp.]|nr:hypothetical protein [Caulobacter sp.]
MPRTLAIFGAMLCLVLGSCVSRPIAPGFAWTYQHNEGEGPKLAYGAPASDNIVLMMTCEPGARRIAISLLGGSPREGLILASGKARQSLRGELVASPGMGQMIEASAHPGSGPLAAFARTGDLSLTDRGRTVKLDASATERHGVTRFFEACRA